MGLSQQDQKRLILDILKSHQADQVTRRNELEQLSRLTQSLQGKATTSDEQNVLNAIQAYCQEEQQQPDGAVSTPSTSLTSLIEDLESYS
ncbi:MAG TPA: YtzH-like family protein [Sporolactobacillaceae bacterium]|nr:YtzH-like family protein [Sporolactobacillaceae bacterium]